MVKASSTKKTEKKINTTLKKIDKMVKTEEGKKKGRGKAKRPLTAEQKRRLVDRLQSGRNFYYENRNAPFGYSRLAREGLGIGDMNERAQFLLNHETFGEAGGQFNRYLNTKDKMNREIGANVMDPYVGRGSKWAVMPRNIEYQDKISISNPMQYINFLKPLNAIDHDFSHNASRFRIGGAPFPLDDKNLEAIKIALIARKNNPKNDLHTAAVYKYHILAAEALTTANNVLDKIDQLSLLRKALYKGTEIEVKAAIETIENYESQRMALNADKSTHKLLTDYNTAIANKTSAEEKALIKTGYGAKALSLGQWALVAPTLAMLSTGTAPSKAFQYYSSVYNFNWDVNKAADSAAAQKILKDNPVVNPFYMGARGVKPLDRDMVGMGNNMGIQVDFKTIADALKLDNAFL